MREVGIANILSWVIFLKDFMDLITIRERMFCLNWFKKSKGESYSLNLPEPIKPDFLSRYNTQSNFPLIEKKTD